LEVRSFGLETGIEEIGTGDRRPAKELLFE